MRTAETESEEEMSERKKDYMTSPIERMSANSHGWR